MEIKKAKSLPIPITGEHAGHHVTLNTKVLNVQTVVGVNDNGDIKIKDFEIDYAGAGDAEGFFYCETCHLDLNCASIGVADTWEVL